MSVAINDLSEVLAVAAGDAIPLYSAEAGATRKTALSVISAFIVARVPSLSGLVRQAAAPSASPFTTTVAPATVGSSVRLIVKPTGTMANGTINLPDVNAARDGQEVLVTCTQIVTTLVVAATGLNVTGAPTTLAANAFFRMMYDAVDLTWYRVG